MDDGREKLLIAGAIAFAIEAYSRLPDQHRPEGDIEDMRAMLDDGEFSKFLRNEARRRLEILLRTASPGSA